MPTSFTPFFLILSLHLVRSFSIPFTVSSKSQASTFLVVSVTMYGFEKACNWSAYPLIKRAVLMRLQTKQNRWLQYLVLTFPPSWSNVRVQWYVCQYDLVSGLCRSINGNIRASVNSLARDRFWKLTCDAVHPPSLLTFRSCANVSRETEQHPVSVWVVTFAIERAE